MSEEAVSAIVLGATDLGESDRLVHLLTRERGRISVRARFARKSRKRFGGRLDRYALIHARLRVRKGRSAFGDVDLVRPFLGIRTDLLRNAMADHLLDLVRLVSREEETCVELFGLLLQALGELDVGPTPGEGWLRARVMKILELAGLAIALDRCCVCGAELLRFPAGFAPGLGGAVCNDHAREGARPLSRGELEWLRTLATLPPGDPRPGDPELGRLVRQHLERFCEYHMERRLRTGSFLDELLDSPS